MTSSLTPDDPDDEPRLPPNESVRLPPAVPFRC